MQANAQRVESIFLRHYRENVLDKREARRHRAEDDEAGESEAGGGAGAQQQPQPSPAGSQQGKTVDQSPTERTRRATRSTGKGLDDWLKIPITATVRVSTGTMETLDGIVYVSVETGRKCFMCVGWLVGVSFLLLTLSTLPHTGLFKQQGKVYFETMWKGAVYKFFISDTELPMISGTCFFSLFFVPFFP